MQRLGLDEATAWRCVGTVKVLVNHQRWFDLIASARKPVYAVLQALLKDTEVQQFIQVNRHQGVLWFNKESFDELAGWLLMLSSVHSLVALPEAEVAPQIVSHLPVIQGLLRAEQASGYRVDRLLAAAE